MIFSFKTKDWEEVKISNFDLDRKLTEAIIKFENFKDKYEELETNETFIKTNIQITEANTDLEACKNYYNDIVTDYNKKVKKFYDLNILETESLKKENNKFTKKINLLTKQKETIVNQMAQTKNYLKNLYEDKVNGIINAEQFKELITNYNSDDEKLKDQLKSIDNEINYYTLKESSNKNTK